MTNPSAPNNVEMETDEVHEQISHDIYDSVIRNFNLDDPNIENIYMSIKRAITPYLPEGDTSLS